MANDPNNPADQPAAGGPAQQAAAEPPNDPNAAGAQAGPGEPLKPMHSDDLIASLRIEIADLKEKILRAYADLDNGRKAADREIDRVRRNAEDEIAKGAKLAIAKFATDICGVSDNFQRAILAVPAGAADRDPALRSLLDGVTLTERELLNVLERHGITRIDPAGELFNPHLHQAMAQFERPDLTAGTVVQVFQVGYTIDGRVLRSAVVAVASGGPKPVREAPPTEAAPAPGGGEQA